MTNNKTEYEAIWTGLRIAQVLGAKNALLRSDSQLVIRQVKGDFEAMETRMQRYLKLTNQLVSKFDKVKFDRSHEIKMLKSTKWLEVSQQIIKQR